MSEPASQLPKAIPHLRTVAIPRDTNSSGAIFGGWTLSQMDLAGNAVETSAPGRFRQRIDRGLNGSVAVASSRSDREWRIKLAESAALSLERGTRASC